MNFNFIPQITSNFLVQQLVLTLDNWSQVAWAFAANGHKVRGVFIKGGLITDDQDGEMALSIESSCGRYGFTIKENEHIPFSAILLLAKEAEDYWVATDTYTYCDISDCHSLPDCASYHIHTNIGNDAYLETEQLLAMYNLEMSEDVGEEELTLYVYPKGLEETKEEFHVTYLDHNADNIDEMIRKFAVECIHWYKSTLSTDVSDVYNGLNTEFMLLDFIMPDRFTFAVEDRGTYLHVALLEMDTDTILKEVNVEKDLTARTYLRTAFGAFIFTKLLASYFQGVKIY